MLTIRVDLSQLDLPRTPEVRQAVKRALQQATRAITTRAEANLSGRFVRIRSGKLRRGMRTKIRDGGDRFIATVRNIVFYGQILEAGAAAHTEPRPSLRDRQRRGASDTRSELAKVLRFQVGGRTVFARAVVIPSLRPRRWFASAVNEALPDLQRVFEREFDALVTRSPLIAPPGGGL